MYTLLLTLFLSGPIDAHGMKRPGAEPPREIHCAQTMPPVIVVADGSSEWPAQAASRIVGELKAELGFCQPVEVARFDAGPALQTRFAVRGENHDLVMVKPRTPMREAVEACLLRLIDAPGPHTMVVIAHEQFYPTSVSQGRLLELAHYTHTTVHTIHYASTRARSGVFRGIGKSLRSGFVWSVETLGLGEKGYSARDTARLLKTMADATGGKACVISGPRAEITCTKSVAMEIMGDADRAE